MLADLRLIASDLGQPAGQQRARRCLALRSRSRQSARVILTGGIGTSGPAAAVNLLSLPMLCQRRVYQLFSGPLVLVCCQRGGRCCECRSWPAARVEVTDGLVLDDQPT